MTAETILLFMMHTPCSGRTGSAPQVSDCKGTSLIRNRPTLGPSSRPTPRALGGPQGGGAVSYERGNPVLPAFALQQAIVSQRSCYRWTSLIRKRPPP